MIWSLKGLWRYYKYYRDRVDERSERYKIFYNQSVRIRYPLNTELVCFHQSSALHELILWWASHWCELKMFVWKVVMILLGFPVIYAQNSSWSSSSSLSSSSLSSSSLSSSSFSSSSLSSSSLSSSWGYYDYSDDTGDPVYYDGNTKPPYQPNEGKSKIMS